MFSLNVKKMSEMLIQVQGLLNCFFGPTNSPNQNTLHLLLEMTKNRTSLHLKKLEQANVLKFLLDNWHKRLINYYNSCLLIHTKDHLQTHTDTQTPHSHIFLHERVLQVQRPRWRTWQGYAHGSMCNSTSLRSMATLTLGGAETERAHGPVTARHPSSTSASETNASQPAAKYSTWNTWWNMQLRASALVRSGVGRPLVTYFLTD